LAKVLVYKNGRPYFEEVPEITVPKEYLERELTEEEKKELDNALIFSTFKNEETGEVMLSPPLGEESIIVRCKEDVEVIRSCLMDYFHS